MTDVRTYRAAVERFREITAYAWPQTRRCCLEVDAHGAPQCCYQIVDGVDQPTFTAREASLLVETGVDERHFVAQDGLWVLDRGSWPSLHALADELHTGWLADTLECASHPTRPILIGTRVVGVVLVDACNARLGLDRYRVQRLEIMHLWQAMVDLLGPKPYYVTYAVKPGWIVL